MSHAITLENLSYYTNYFSRLKKADVNYEINKNEKYVNTPTGSYYQLGFHATFKGVKNINGLANIWSVCPTPISLDAVEAFPGYSGLQLNINTQRINDALYRKNHPAIRFYSQDVLEGSPRISLYLISGTVPETVYETHSIRTCITGGIYNGGQLVYCSNENSPYYNYIDKGHIIVYVSTGEHVEDGSRLFITDAVTLDMNYIIAAASIYPPAIDDILQNKAFLPSKDCRLSLLKAEKAIPAKLRDNYIALKTKIQED